MTTDDDKKAKGAPPAKPDSGKPAAEKSAAGKAAAGKSAAGKPESGKAAAAGKTAAEKPAAGVRAQSGAAAKESAAAGASGAPDAGKEARRAPPGAQGRKTAAGDDGGRRRRRGGRGRGRGDSRGGDDYVDRLVSVNRVAKVVKGGRRFGFAALVVVGDSSGRVGFANGKAREVAEAIRKAAEKAKNRMISVPLREGRTLHYDVAGRFGAGRVVLRSAPGGTGIIAGGPMRAIFEVLGVEDVVAKSVGSSNPHNMVRATMAALGSIQSPQIVAARRGLSLSDLEQRRAAILGAGRRPEPALKSAAEQAAKQSHETTRP